MQLQVVKKEILAQAKYSHKSEASCNAPYKFLKTPKNQSIYLEMNCNQNGDAIQAILSTSSTTWSRLIFDFFSSLIFHFIRIENEKKSVWKDFSDNDIFHF